MTDSGDVSPADAPLTPGQPGEQPRAADAGTTAAGAAGEGGTRRHQWAALAGFTAVTGAAAAAGVLAGPRRSESMRWYRSLAKPPFQPPAAAFAPVWTGLYAAIAVSGWRVWRRPDSPDRTRALRLWAAQMAANAAWTPLFFGARRTVLALADLSTLLPSAAGYTRAAARVDPPAAALMAPYLGWTAFAGVLNAEIVRRNR